jgi:hypothetical protein
MNLKKFSVLAFLLAFCIMSLFAWEPKNGYYRNDETGYVIGVDGRGTTNGSYTLIYLNSEGRKLWTVNGYATDYGSTISVTFTYGDRSYSVSWRGSNPSIIYDGMTGKTFRWYQAL